MISDTELLRCYAAERSESAFTELVQRHLRLVYGCALRRVGHDAQLAEDVAQKVFTDLARKAASLTAHTTLSGWLYVSTHHASAEIVRSERRRKAREEKAHSMQTTSPDPTSAPDWEHLRPVLDDLIYELKDVDRTAVVLRFFEQRSFAEVGAALRLTEEAARKRVDRSLEKLRDALAQRGVTSTATALGVALTSTAVASAPTGLAAKVAHAALAPAAAAGAGAGTVAFFGSGFAVAGAALVLVGAFGVGLQHRTNRQLAAELSTLQAEHTALSALRSENQSLTRRAQQTDDLLRLQANLPALRDALARVDRTTATPLANPTKVAISITAEGSLRWGADPVTLREFISRLKTLQEQTPAGAARVEIHASELSAFSQVAYVIDEVRKAKLQLVVNSVALPDAKVSSSWF